MEGDGVELTFRRVSGLRPFVVAEVNAHPVSLMVHSNAGFGAMVTHDVAARVGLQLGSDRRLGYGIDSVGRPGPRGRTSAVADLRVGQDLARDVEFAVFDVPQDEPVDGMLGIGWLRARGAVVDFGRGRLSFGGAPGGTNLVWDDDWQAYVVVTPTAGQFTRFVVSTVAGVVVDTVAAERLRLALGPVIGADGGPTGTVVDIMPIETTWDIDLDGRPRFVDDALAWDIYAYADRPRPAADQIDGFLGCEFLAREAAVVDFGAGSLRLRP